MAAVDRQVVYDSVRQFVVHDRVNFFFFNATATTGIYTLSLHDALPIYRCLVWGLILLTLGMVSGIVWAHTAWGDRKSTRLNSSHVAISYAVFCLKKKKTSWSSSVGPAPRSPRFPSTLTASSRVAVSAVA